MPTPRDLRSPLDRPAPWWAALLAVLVIVMTVWAWGVLMLAAEPRDLVLDWDAERCANCGTPMHAPHSDPVAELLRGGL